MESRAAPMGSSIMYTETLFNLGSWIISFLGRYRAVHESRLGMAICRVFYNALCATCTGAPEAVHSTQERTIPGPGGPLRLRIYRGTDEQHVPAIIFVHGGAFCLGDLNSHDTSVRALANAAACVVVVVEYRLAPEHQYPAAANDVYSTLEWLTDNAEVLGIDPSRIVLAGDSAGGAIAAVVSRWATERIGPKVAFQLLIYPMTDASTSTASWERFKHGPVLNRDVIRAAWSRYCPDVRRFGADISPLAATRLKGLPPAIIITGERDPLQGEGRQYAEALMEQGVPVSLKHYQGSAHGFFQIPSTKRGRLLVTDIARTLSTNLAPKKVLTYSK
jgi:Esterase/lipase